MTTPMPTAADLLAGRKRFSSQEALASSVEPWFDAF